MTAMRSPPHRDTLRWTLLGSVWVHLAVLVSLRSCSVDPAALASLGPVGEPLEVIRIRAEVLLPLPHPASVARHEEVPPQEEPTAPELIDLEDDGVADVALEVPPIAELLDRTEATPMPVPPEPRLADAPEPEEPEEPEQPEERDEEEDPWTPFVDVSGMEASEDPAIAEFISALSTQTDEMARTSVSSSEVGPATPSLDGSETRPAPPALMVRVGSPEDPRGARAPTIQPEGGAAGGGGGRSGLRQGDGARTKSGQRLSGGPAASAGGGSTGSTAPHASMAPGPRGERPVGPAPAPDGLRPAPGERSPWWQPIATRILVVSPEPEPVPEPVPVIEPTATVDVRAPVAERSHNRDSRPPSPTDRAAVALVDHAGDRADDGGTDSESEEEASPERRVDHREGRAERGETEAVDPIEDLRKALGWGGMDRAHLYPDASISGMASSEGAPARSWQAVLDEEVTRVDYVAVTSTETPLGRYQQRNIEELRAAYSKEDLSLDLRAKAIQGETTLEFKIRPSGRVEQIVLTRSSGHLELDRMAFEAIPRRLHRMPRPLREEYPRGLWQRITFHYLNPMVITEGR